MGVPPYRPESEPERVARGGPRRKRAGWNLPPFGDDGRPVRAADRDAEIRRRREAGETGDRYTARGSIPHGWKWGGAEGEGAVDLDLRPFQRQFVADVLAPGVRTAALSIPRGNGKSTLVASLAARTLRETDPLHVAGRGPRTPDP